MKFVVTVDTEADNQWDDTHDLTVNNIKYLDRFQELCNKYDIIPTYLVTQEVVMCDRAVSFLGKAQKDGHAEIGSHLHPWTNDPLEEDELSGCKRFPCGLSDDLLQKKLKSLTEIIKYRFGVNPVSYRAGRWGFDSRQIDYLVDLGYIVDCSHTPKVSWKRKNSPIDKHGPDFRSSTIKPSLLKGKTKKILEVPMSILFTGLCKREGSLFGKFFVNLPNIFLKKVLNRLFFRQKWLRVFENSKLSDWDRIFVSAEFNKLPVLEFMIHSSELMPGGSPYFKTEEDIDFLYKNIEYIFKLTKKYKLESQSLSQFAIFYKKTVYGF